jgi:hypothetical protein
VPYVFLFKKAISDLKEVCECQQRLAFNKNIVQRSAEIMFFAQAVRALRKCNFRTPDYIYVKSSLFHVSPDAYNTILSLRHAKNLSIRLRQTEL